MAIKLISVVAASENNVIGIGNKMPWHLPDDLKFFKRTTLGNPIIMGRNTWASIGERALPNRINIVLSRSMAKPNEDAGYFVFNDLEEALEWLQSAHNCEKAFIVGGGHLYKETMPIISEMYITRVHKTIENGEVFFPEFNKNEWTKVMNEFHDVDEKHQYSFTFEHWVRN